MIPTPTPVIPGLYLTSENITLERELLLRMKITHILSVGAGPRQGHHPGVFEHLRIGIKDAITSDLLQILPRCFEFIQQGMEKGNVVVHCKAGRSRSASVVMAYLIKLDPSLSLADALLKVRVARATAQPNPGFMSQLETFRNSLNVKEQEEDKEDKEENDPIYTTSM